MRRKAFITAFLSVGLVFSAEGLLWAASPTPDMARGVAHYIMGVSAELAGDTEAAQEAYARSVKADGTRSASHFRLALLEASRGDTGSAFKEFTAAAAIDPQDLRIKYFLALLYTGQKDPDNAAAEYEKILQALSTSDPSNTEVLISLAGLYRSRGQMAPARACFEKALQITPDDPDLMYVTGGNYLDMNERRKAETIFKRCISVNGAHAGCLNSLSYTYAEDGHELKKALRLVDRALVVDPVNAAYLDTRGWVLYRLGDPRHALSALLQADARIKAPDILDHIAQVYAALDRPDLARMYWLEALGMDKDLPDIKAKLKALDDHKVMK